MQLIGGFSPDDLNGANDLKLKTHRFLSFLECPMRTTAANLAFFRIPQRRFSAWSGAPPCQPERRRPCGTVDFLAGSAGWKR